MFRIFFLNLGYLLITGLSLLISLFISVLPLNPTVINILIYYTVISLIMVYSGAVNGMTRDIADYKEPGFRDFFTHLKNSYKVSLLFGFLLSTVVFICFISMDIYNSSDIFFRFIAQPLILGVLLIILTASQYFHPIYFGLDKRFKKIIKKMFLIFFDNPLFTFGLLIMSVILVILSFFTIFMIPGFTSIALLLNVGLKLRLYKYDYLETRQNPDERNVKIPWETLLIEDRERVGKRTLKNMIFPWKD